MRWFPFALFFGTFLAAAQNAPVPAPAPDSANKNARVEGTILSLNGDVVRKATVRLQGGATQPGQVPTNYTESTDNGGRFVFEGIAPGRYALSAEKAGFITARYGARSNQTPGTQLNLTAGTELKGVSIKMTPQGVIAGKVLDQDGDPVVSSQVQVLRYVYVRGRKQLQLSGTGATNDLGEYRIINLAPGRYYLSATDRRNFAQLAQERPGRADEAQLGNIMTYYQNGADATSAVPVEVAAGGEMRGIDIRLLQAKVYTVRGKAVVASGATPQAIISFTRKEDSGNLPAILNGGTSQLRPDGSFEFHNIAPGTYILQFLQSIGVNGSQPAGNLTGRVEVTVSDANIDGLVFPLSPGPEITGTVRLEDGDITTLLKPAQNVSGAAIAGNPVVLQPGRLALTLIATESSPVGAATAQVKEDGTFRFNAVIASRYQLNVLLPQGTYLKSALFAGQDVTHSPIDATSGAGGTLELVLSSKAADAAGSVQNDKGETQAGVMVTIWPKLPDASPTGGIRQTFTDQNGGFKFQSLAPGDYYMAAWEELEPGLATSADFLSHFASDTGAIKLVESGHESRDLKIVPSDKILAEIAKLP